MGKVTWSELNERYGIKQPKSSTHSSETQKKDTSTKTARVTWSELNERYGIEQSSIQPSRKSAADDVDRHWEHGIYQFADIVNPEDYTDPAAAARYNTEAREYNQSLRDYRAAVKADAKDRYTYSADYYRRGLTDARQKEDEALDRWLADDGWGSISSDRETVMTLARAATEAVERREAYEDMLKTDEMSRKTYDADFGGQFAANIMQGRLSGRANEGGFAWKENDTDYNRLRAEAAARASAQFWQNNDEALNGDTTVNVLGAELSMPWFTKSLAQYLPQLAGQTKSSVVPALFGGALGFAVGNPIGGAKLGASLGSGRYNYEQVAGAAYMALREAGYDHETASAMAGDEANISALIESGETYLSLSIMPGVGKLAGNLGIKGVSEVGESIIKKVVAKTGIPEKAVRLLFGAAEIGMQGVSEGAEEFTQNIVSDANLRRDGDTGAWDLVKESLSYGGDVLRADPELVKRYERLYNDPDSVSEEERELLESLAESDPQYAAARSRVEAWAAAKEGAKIGWMMGGAGSLATAGINAGINTGIDEYVTRRVGKEYNRGNEGVEGLIEQGLMSPQDTESFRLATELRRKLDNGEKLTNRQVGRLVMVEADARLQQAEIQAAGTPNVTFDGITAPKKSTAQRVREAYGYTGHGNAAFVAALEDNELAEEPMTEQEVFARFNPAYEAGLQGKGYKAKSNLESLAYRAGLDDSAARVKRAEGSVQRAVVHKGGLVTADDGSVLAKGSVDTKYHKKLSRGQRALLDRYGEMTGTKIVFDKTLKDYQNGAYDPDTGTIRLSPEHENPLSGLANHEVVHRLKHTAPEAYKALLSFATEATESMGGMSAIQVQRQSYLDASEGDINLSVEGAQDEIVAHVIEDIANNPALQRRTIEFAQRGTNERASVQKLIDTVREVIEWFKGLLKGKNESFDSKFGLTLEEMEHGMDLFEAALLESEANVKKRLSEQSVEPKTEVEAEVKPKSNPAADAIMDFSELHGARKAENPADDGGVMYSAKKHNKGKASTKNAGDKAGKKKKTEHPATSPLSRGSENRRSIGTTHQMMSATAAAELLGVDNISNASDSVKHAVSVLGEICASIGNDKCILGFRSPVSASNFRGMLVSMGVLRREGSGASAYRYDKGHGLRISNHSAHADNFRGKGAEEHLSIAVFESGQTNPFEAGGRNVIEAQFKRYYLDRHPEVFKRLLCDIARFIASGEYHDTAGAAKYGFSGTNEFITQAEKRMDADKKLREEQSAESFSLKSTEDEEAGMMYSFHAPMSHESISRAEQMERDGVDSEAIRKQTGLFRGYDGKWRVEMDDSQMVLAKKISERMTLGQLISHPTLFEAFPDMADMPVSFHQLRGRKGGYIPGEDCIVLKRSLMTDRDALQDTLMHEIQHAIQRREGFAGGANVRHWEERLQEGFDSRRKEAIQKSAELQKRYADIRREQPKFFEDMMELEEMKPTIPRGRVDMRTLQRLEEDPAEWKRFDERRGALEARYGELAVWDFMDLLYDIKLARTKDVRDAKALYYDTAGEIEARDAAERRNLTAAERKEKRPDIDYRDAVFAEDIRYSLKGVAEDSDSVYTEDSGIQYSMKPKWKPKLKPEEWGIVRSVMNGYRPNDTWEADEITIGFYSKSKGYQVFGYYSTDDDTLLYAVGGKKAAKDNTRREEVYRRYVNNGTDRTRRSVDRCIGSLGSQSGNRGVHPNSATNRRATVGTGELSTAVSENRGQNTEQGRNHGGSESDSANAIKSQRDAHQIAKEIRALEKRLKRKNLTSGKKKEIRKEIRKLQKEFDAVFHNPFWDRQHSLKGQSDLLRENARLRKANARLRQQFKRTKFAKVDEKSLDKFTRQLLRDYGSELTPDEIRGKLEELYTYMANGEDGESPMWSEVQQRAYEIARVVLENALAADDELYRSYSDLRHTLRTTGITLDARYSGDLMGYESLEAFRQANMGRIKITKNGTPVDVFYQELANSYPEFFDDTEYSHPADQLTHIAEVLDRLQPVAFNPFDSGMQEHIAGLAYDIIDRFFELPQAKPTYADKADAKLKAQKAYDRKKLDKLRAEKNAKLEEVKGHYREKESKMSESRKASVLRKKIQRHSAQMHRKLMKPTDKQHIPEIYRSAVTMLLEAINLESGYETGVEYVFAKDGSYRIENRRFNRDEPGVGFGSVATKRTAAFEAVRDEYLKMIADEQMVIDPDLLSEPEYGPSKFDKVIAMKDKPIANMTSTELQIMWEVLRSVEKSISTYGKILSTKKFWEVRTWAEAMVEDTATRRPRKTKPPKKNGKESTSIRLAYEDPYTFFSHFGNAGKAIFDMLIDADCQRDNIQREIAAEMHKIVDRKTVNQLETKVYDYTTEEGHDLHLTAAHIMYLYLVNAQPDGHRHLIYSGIMQPAVQRKFARGDKAVLLTDGDISNIIATLREDNPAAFNVADKVRALTELLAKYGNEASMKVYGYRKFAGNTKYFPLWIVREQTKSTTEKSAENVRSIESISAAQSRNPAASNAIELGSIFDVFANHVKEMTEYAAWMPVMKDLGRLYNFRFRNGEGKTVDTVKGIVERYGGKGAQDYWEKLTADIQNGIRASYDVDVMATVMRFYGNAKGANVGSNVSVWLQQFTSYPRAAAVLSPVSMTKGLNKGVMEGNGWKKAYEYSAIARRKADGGFDLGNDVTIREKLYDDTNAFQRFNELGQLPSAMADQITWGCLWNACEHEVADRGDSPTVGSEQFIMAVTELFEDVIHQTQVIDTVLHRAPVMRSKHDYMRQATSYKGEPLKQLNMVLRADDAFRYEQDKGKKVVARKKLARSIASLAVSSVLVALVQSFPEAWRDEEDDEFWSKVWRKFIGISEDDLEMEDSGEDRTIKDYIKHYGGIATDVLLEGNLGTSLNPLELVPYFSDFLSLIKGYDISRGDMDVIADVWSAGVDFFETIFGDGKKTIFAATYNLAKECGKAAGFSAPNLLRDIFGIARQIAYETDNVGFMYKMEKAIHKISNTDNKGRFIDIAFTAWQKGDMEAYDKIVAELVDNGVALSTIESGIRSRVKKAGIDANSLGDITFVAGLRPYYAETKDEGETNFSKDSLSGADAIDYSRLYGETVEELTDDLMSSPVFRDLDDDTKNALLKAAYEYAEDTALQQFATKDDDFALGAQWMYDVQDAEKVGVDAGDYILFFKGTDGMDDTEKLDFIDRMGLTTADRNELIERVFFTDSEAETISKYLSDDEYDDMARGYVGYYHDITDGADFSDWGSEVEEDILGMAARYAYQWALEDTSGGSYVSTSQFGAGSAKGTEHIEHAHNSGLSYEDIFEALYWSKTFDGVQRDGKTVTNSKKNEFIDWMRMQGYTKAEQELLLRACGWKSGL